MSEIHLKRRDDDPEYKLSCLISRLTGGLYSKAPMTLDQIMFEHEAWHERNDEKLEQLNIKESVAFKEGYDRAVQLLSDIDDKKGIAYLKSLPEKERSLCL